MEVCSQTSCKLGGWDSRRMEGKFNLCAGCLHRLFLGGSKMYVAG